MELTSGPGSVTYTYRVTNPGTIPLSAVTVVDDKLSPVTYVSGDVNTDSILQPGEVWMYTGTTTLTETTTNTVTATGTAGETPVSDTAVITVTVTTPVISKTVTKVWDDNDNQDGLRPPTVWVQLLADGVPAGIAGELNVGNLWSYTWDELPVYNAGVEIVYTVAEITAVPEYGTTYNQEASSITNTHTPAVTSKTVTKVWDDNDNVDRLRPASVMVQLLADGSPVGQAAELNAGNSWSQTWHNLPVNKDGKAIVYTVKEITSIDGYKVTYDQEALKITNVHVPAKVIIPKTGDTSSGYGLTFLLGFIGLGALGYGIYRMRKTIKRR
jgi:hypothetical protein